MKKVFLFGLMLLILTGCASQISEEEVVNVEEEVVIALIDTGVTTGAINGEHVLDGYNYVNDSTETSDTVNHGTAIASIILGSKNADIESYAPDSYVVPLVVMSKNQGKLSSGGAEALTKAIYDSIDTYKADIINISIGTGFESSDLKEAVDYAQQKGVLVVSAVGTGVEDETVYYPAAYDSVIAVGSCDENGVRSSFSQVGADVLAQGQDLWLASRKGYSFEVKGTSYATGFVVAKAANILKDNPEISVDQLRQEVIDSFD